MRVTRCRARVLLALLFAAVGAAASGIETPRAREKKIARLEKGTALEDARLDVSPDAARAVVIHRGEDGKWRVLAGGKDGPGFDEVIDSQFSPDGRRYFYVGKSLTDGGSAYTVVLDFQERGTYDSPVGSPAFSRDGKAAYVVSQASGTASSPDIGAVPILKKGVAVDGVVDEWFDGFVGDPVFDPKNGSLAFLTSRLDFTTPVPYKNVWTVVSGAARREVRCPVPSNAIASVHFDADGRLYVFSPSAACVEVDGQAATDYQAIGVIEFDPESGGLAYVAARQGKQYVVSSRGEKGPYDRVFKLGASDDRPIWTASRDGDLLVATPEAEFQPSAPPDRCVTTPDLRHVACLIPQAGSDGVFVDGRVIEEPAAAGPSAKWASWLALDQAGDRVAYELVGDQSDAIEVQDLRSGRTFRSPDYSRVDFPRLSDDGEELRFAAVKGRDVLSVSLSLPR